MKRPRGEGGGPGVKELGNEQGQIIELAEKYKRLLSQFPKESREERITAMEQALQVVIRRLRSAEDIVFDEMQETILRLKMARHFQRNSSIDTNTLYDALFETPRFMNEEKGSFHRLFEIHEEKTLVKIAEIRKQRAEMTGQEEFNPYEYIYSTTSGDYTLARLLNMPHLQQESEYMKHCVGTSDSYINRMKRGEIEILSFRSSPRMNNETQKFEGDDPLVTMEYNPKTKEILQMKKQGDKHICLEDPFWGDLVETLENLNLTNTDTGNPRTLSKINPHELKNIPVKDYCLLTSRGEVNFREYPLGQNVFVIKAGKIPLTADISREDAAKLITIFEGKTVDPRFIARTQREIQEETRVYVGPLFKGIFDLKHLEEIYTSFPEGRIHEYHNIEVGGKTKVELATELTVQGFQISDDARQMIESPDFTTSTKSKKINLFRLNVGDLGFSHNPTIDEIYRKAQELGLGLCPAEVVPHFMLQYKHQFMNDYLYVGMKQITASGHLCIFTLDRSDDGVWLNDSRTDSLGQWQHDRSFVFSRRTSET